MDGTLGLPASVPASPWIRTVSETELGSSTRSAGGSGLEARGEEAEYRALHAGLNSGSPALPPGAECAQTAGPAEKGRGCPSRCWRLLRVLP